MGRSRGFGSINCDLNGLFSLGFPSPAALKALGLPQSITRRPIMQKVRGQTTLAGSVLPLFVGIRVQVLLTLLSQYFSTFNRPTGSLSVIQEYLALGDGPPGFMPDFTSPALLWYP